MHFHHQLGQNNGKITGPKRYLTFMHIGPPYTIYWFPAIPGIGKVPWVCALPDQVPTADPVNVLVLFRILGGLQSVLGPRGL